jgi:hypothetical protein
MPRLQRATVIHVPPNVKEKWHKPFTYWHHSFLGLNQNQQKYWEQMKSIFPSAGDLMSSPSSVTMPSWTSSPWCLWRPSAGSYVSLGPNENLICISAFLDAHTSPANQPASNCYRLLTLHMIAVDSKASIVRLVTVIVGIVYTTSSSPCTTDNFH